MPSDKFVMNTSAVSNMSENIQKQSNEYLKLIEETTAIVNDLAAHWEGATYQTFREGYFSHLASLEELNQSLNSLAKELEDKANATRASAAKIMGILGK